MVNNFTFKMKQQKNIPLLATLFYQYGLEGFLFFRKIGSKFYCIEFMPDLILHSVPSVSVVIHPVVPSLVYLISLTSEVITV